MTIALFVGWSGLSRIGRYVADMPVSFPTIDKAESYFRTIHATYGELPDRYWRHLDQHSVSWNEERQHYATLCDPAIAVAFRTPWYSLLDLWKYWEAIRVPILVLHGSKSDLLTAGLTREMVNCNRRATVHRFPERGDVPPLMAAHQLDVIEAFLAEGTRRRRPGATEHNRLRRRSFGGKRGGVLDEELVKAANKLPFSTGDPSSRSRR